MQQKRNLQPHSVHCRSKIAMTTDEKTILCPSSKCEDGATLLGVVQKDGHVSFLSKKMVVNQEFVEIARSGRSPEKRFRFSNKCMQGSCAQWSVNRCGIIDKLIETFGPRDEPSELPNCSIRAQCRWYKQHGGRACVVCPETIYDNSMENNSINKSE